MMRIEFLYSKLMNSIAFFFLILSSLTYVCCVCCYLPTKKIRKKLLSLIQFSPRVTSNSSKNWTVSINGDWIKCFYASFISITRLDLYLLPSPFDTITVNTHGFNRLFFLLQQRIKKNLLRVPNTAYDLIDNSWNLVIPTNEL